MFSYLLHLIRAKGPDRVHSPFVFDLYFHTLKNNYKHYSFNWIEKQDNGVTKSENVIGESLFKIVNKFHPSNILFISESSTKNVLYISKARNKTMIDCFSTKNMNLKLIEKQKNINIITESQILNQNKRYEIIIIDLQTTFLKLDYSKFKNIPIIIITNINSDESQKKYWQKTLESEAYNIHLDFYYFGIALHRREQKKEYFLLRL